MVSYKQNWMIMIKVGELQMFELKNEHMLFSAPFFWNVNGDRKLECPDDKGFHNKKVQKLKFVVDGGSKFMVLEYISL